MDSPLQVSVLRNPKGQFLVMQIEGVTSALTPIAGHCYTYAMSKRNKKKILIQLTGIPAASAINDGILAYASGMSDWELYLCDNFNIYSPIRYNPSLVFDGAIVENQSDTFADIKTIVCYNATPFTKTPRKWGRVICDNAAIAKMATDLLVSRKFTNFAFAGGVMNPRWSPAERWSDFRETAFVKALRQRGFKCSVHRPHPSEDFESLVAWLKGLSFPCALFAANDLRAMDVMNACNHLGFSIPEQISILGVDNEEYICDYATPSISSILPDFYGAGQQAARLLNRLLSGTCRSGTIEHYGPATMIERQSTRSDNSMSYIVARAQSFINGHCTHTISVRNVAATVGCTPRYLEKSFNKIVGKTVITSILDARLENIRAKLETTHKPIETLAHESGFKSANYLRNAFRRRYGMSMTEWRSRFCQPLRG